MEIRDQPRMIHRFCPAAHLPFHPSGTSGRQSFLAVARTREALLIPMKMIAITAERGDIIKYEDISH